MQSLPETQDASLSTADTVLRVNCFERRCRREGRPAPCGPPFVDRMAPNDSARQEWASEPPSSGAATETAKQPDSSAGTTEVPVGTKANIEARRILEPFS